MAAKAAAETMIEDDDRGTTEAETTQSGGGKNAQSEVAEDQFEVIEGEAPAEAAADKAGETREASLSEEEAGDAPLVGDGSDKRGKASHAERRRRQKEGRDRNLRELAELRAQNEELRARVGKVEETSGRHTLQTIETAISAEEKNFRDAEARLSQALTDVATGKATPEAVTLALRERDATYLRGQRLVGQKNAMANASRGDTQREAPQTQQAYQPSPQVVSHIQDFQDKHDWFDPDTNSTDEASNILRSIDRSVAADGFNPANADYWQELEKRAARRLPEYFSNEGATNGNGQRQVKPERRGPMTAAPGARSPVSGKTQVRLTPARKEALIDAGVLDKDGTVTNKPKFSRLLKGFAEYDAQNSGVRQ